MRTVTGSGGVTLVELIRTNDPVLLGFVESLLASERVPVLVTDRHTSAIEGSIGAFQPRILVPEDWAAKARRILIEAGLAAELRGA